MENITPTPQFSPDLNIPSEKPQFLKVLCILTWCCCGLLFLSSVWGLVFKPSEEKQLEQIEKMRELSPEMGDKMEDVLANQNGTKKLINDILAIVAIALSFYGSLLIWQLKKRGFYFYLAGEILPYFGFLLGGAEAMGAVGAMPGGIGKAIVGVTLTLMVVFDLAFIIMYAVNLKYMNKTQQVNS